MAKTANKINSDYSAADIEVLESLEAVRRRPGMYIGGSDNAAMHHLAAEIIDNSMDEAIAGHATQISCELLPGNILKVQDNGRGIPCDPHPRFPKKSAMEIILTTLHSGGKFSGDNYTTSGGLHGVGLSVVNALSSYLLAESSRGAKLSYLECVRGELKAAIQAKPSPRDFKRGTRISFCPDTQIFNDEQFNPEILYQMLQSKAALHAGIIIDWRCSIDLPADNEAVRQARFHFPARLSRLSAIIGGG